MKNYTGSNFNNIYSNIIEDLHYQPECTSTSRKGEKLYELIYPQINLLNPYNCFATCRGMSFKYLKGELDFYISGSPYLKDIVKHSKFWSKVTDDERTINSNYGKLLLHDRNYHNYTQFEYAKDMLIQNKESKKAVMTIYSKENAHKSNDNPCTMFLQFLIREDHLHLFVNMRSSDIWYGMPYDIPFFVYIQFKMLKELRRTYKELEVGIYNHRSGSLHMYDRNKKQIEKVFEYENLLEDQKDLFDKYIGVRL